MTDTLCGILHRFRWLRGNLALTACAIVEFALCNFAFADEATDRAQLTTCVQQHLTAEDQTLAARLMIATVAYSVPSAASPGNDSQGFAAKRETVAADVARFIARVARQDCKPEVQAVLADKISGGPFGIMYGQLTASLQSSVQRGSVAMALEIFKNFDANFIGEIGLVPPSSSAPSLQPAPGTQSTPSGSQSVSRKAAVATGVRARLDFQTTVNPDCSTLGETVIRIAKPPSHGTATIEAGKGFTSYPATNPRYQCNAKETQGTVLYYKSQSRYTGPDSLTYRVIFATGVDVEVNLDIAVN